jgi:O-antigen/teichoic acid export membrane protein
VTSHEPSSTPDARTNADIQETTARALPWIALARIAVEILGLASMVVLARLIPPSAFGIFALALIVQELAIVLPGEGIGSALVQRRSITRDHMQAGFAVSLLVGLGFALLTLLLAYLVVQPLFGHTATVLVALTTPWYLLGAIMALPTAELRRRLDFRRVAILDVVMTFVKAVASVVFAAAFGLDAMALLLGGTVSLVAGVLLACAYVRPPLPRWHSAAVRDLWPYTGPSILATISWTGFRNGDYAIVGARLGAAAAGLYWRGYQLGVEYQRKVSVIMSQVAFPMLSRTLNDDEMFALRERMVRLVTTLVFPLLALLVVLAPVLIPWLFGSDWNEAILPTQILAAGGAAALVTDITGSILKAVGRTKAILWWGTGHFVVYVIAILIASLHGLTAVCIASVSVHSAFVAVGYWVLLQNRPERTLPLLWRDIRAATLSCAGLVAVAWPVNAVLGEGGVPALPRMVLAAAAGGIAYLVTLRLISRPALHDLTRVVRRVVPDRVLRAGMRRVPVFANR